MIPNAYLDTISMQMFYDIVDIRSFYQPNVFACEREDLTGPQMLNSKTKTIK